MLLKTFAAIASDCHCFQTLVLLSFKSPLTLYYTISQEISKHSCLSLSDVTLASLNLGFQSLCSKLSWSIFSETSMGIPYSTFLVPLSLGMFGSVRELELAEIKDSRSFSCSPVLTVIWRALLTPLSQIPGFLFPSLEWSPQSCSVVLSGQWFSIVIPEPCQSRHHLPSAQRHFH